jgi:hypothetical protein
VAGERWLSQKRTVSDSSNLTNSGDLKFKGLDIRPYLLVRVPPRTRLTDRYLEMHLASKAQLPRTRRAG